MIKALVAQSEFLLATNTPPPASADKANFGHDNIAVMLNLIDNCQCVCVLPED